MLSSHLKQPARDEKWNSLGPGRNHQNERNYTLLFLVMHTIIIFIEKQKSHEIKSGSSRKM